MTTPLTHTQAYRVVKQHCVHPSVSFCFTNSCTSFLKTPTRWRVDRPAVAYTAATVVCNGLLCLCVTLRYLLCPSIDTIHPRINRAHTHTFLFSFGERVWGSRGRSRKCHVHDMYKYQCHSNDDHICTIVNIHIHNRRHTHPGQLWWMYANE
jgi:hypothetical protein